ncbi:MAG: CYCXC family (seleno)protein [Gemmatimonadales bacterium]
MIGSAVSALLVLGVLAQRDDGPAGHHPTPRADAHAAHTMPVARYASIPRTAEVYAMAAEIPEVLDGIYCYCFCSETFGHYSLLDCFLSDHAAGCDVCMEEAAIAYEMTSRGESLDAIRQVVDQQYRRT